MGQEERGDVHVHESCVDRELEVGDHLGDLVCLGQHRLRPGGELQRRAGSVADEPVALGGYLGNHAERGDLLEIEVVAESSGDDHLIDLVDRHVDALEKYLDPRVDRRLGSHEVLDVGLGDHDVDVDAALLGPDEHVLVSHVGLANPLGVVAGEEPVSADRLTQEELGDAVDQTAAADAERLRCRRW